MQRLSAFFASGWDHKEQNTSPPGLSPSSSPPNIPLKSVCSFSHQCQKGDTNKAARSTTFQESLNRAFFVLCMLSSVSFHPSSSLQSQTELLLRTTHTNCLADRQTAADRLTHRKELESHTTTWVSFWTKNPVSKAMCPTMVILSEELHCILRPREFTEISTAFPVCQGLGCVLLLCLFIRRKSLKYGR